MITLAAIPNDKRTSWSIAVFSTSGNTSFYYLGEPFQDKASAVFTARAVRKLLGIEGPPKGDRLNYEDD